MTVFNNKISSFREIISNSKMPQELIEAALYSLPSDINDERSFWLAAVGIRHDGCKVISRNGNCSFSKTVEQYQKLSSNHAEGRVVRKMGKEGIIFVSRVSRLDGTMVMARCCPMCQTIVQARKISKVYYTINENQYGLWEVKKDKDRIFTI